jgi:hypothetical protein
LGESERRAEKKSERDDAPSDHGDTTLAYVRCWQQRNAQHMDDSR